MSIFAGAAASCVGVGALGTGGAFVVFGIGGGALVVFGAEGGAGGAGAGTGAGGGALAAILAGFDAGAFTTGLRGAAAGALGVGAALAIAGFFLMAGELVEAFFAAACFGTGLFIAGTALRRFFGCTYKRERTVLFGGTLRPPALVGAPIGDTDAGPTPPSLMTLRSTITPSTFCAAAGFVVRTASKGSASKPARRRGIAKRW